MRGLVVDLGSLTMTAAVVTDQGTWFVPDPGSGASVWPAAVHWDGHRVWAGALAEQNRRVDPAGQRRPRQLGVHPAALRVDHPVADRPGVVQARHVEGGQAHQDGRRRGPGDDRSERADPAVLTFDGHGGRRELDGTARRDSAAGPHHRAVVVAAALRQRLVAGAVDVLQDRLFPLHAALFSDASPGPVKYALSRVKNGFSAELRAPMTEPSDASRKAVDDALAHAGLI